MRNQRSATRNSTLSPAMSAKTPRRSKGPVSSARSKLIWALLGLAIAATVGIENHSRPVQAHPGTLLVSPFGDDMGGANDCSSPDQPCKTIQNAINHASSGDLIELAPGTYPENVTVNQSVTIQGDAFNPSIVDGGGLSHGFLIQDLDVSSAPLSATLSMLTVTNGNAGSSGNEGGGIQNHGTLTVVQTTINGNTAGASSPAGGGIFNDGTLTVINSTISGNSAGDGGGIFNGGTTTVVNSTIKGNTGSGGGGLTNSNTHTVNLTNTIIAGSLGPDCNNGGVIGTNSHNLVQDGTCSPAVSGDPKLGPLQNNGGPTFTHALLAGSPAIDAGDDTVLGDPFNLTTDQRGPGFPRKVCAHVDIGATEFNAGATPTVTCPGNIVTVSDPGKTTATVSFTVTASDLCDGALNPTCTIANVPISSPFAFPAGVTTVICSATNSQGNTGMCSFTVTVTLLTGCIQDDHTGDTFRFNPQTGQYLYTRCKDKFTLTGTGIVRTVGGLVTITDIRPDRRISATFNTGQLTGHASLTVAIVPGVFQSITVNQTNPHPTCQCP